MTTHAVPLHLCSADPPGPRSEALPLGQVDRSDRGHALSRLATPGSATQLPGAGTQGLGGVAGLGSVRSNPDTQGALVKLLRKDPGAC